MSARLYGTHPLSVPSAEIPLHIGTERTMFADFAARGRSGLKSRELHWSTPVKLAAVQSSPWLRSGSYFPNPNKQRKTNNKRANTHTNNQRESRQTKETKNKKQGGENPQKDRNDMAAPVKFKANSTRRQWILAPEQQERSQESPNLSIRGESNQSHTNPEANEGGEAERREGRAAGAGPNTDTGKPHTPEGGEGARRQQRTGGERARENQRGYSSALTDVPWGSWNIKDEYLSAAEQSNAKPFQSGVEGDKTPHRAEPLMPQ